MASHSEGLNTVALLSGEFFHGWPFPLASAGAGAGVPGNRSCVASHSTQAVPKGGNLGVKILNCTPELRPQKMHFGAVR
jgi:hypothetical protein